MIQGFSTAVTPDWEALVSCIRREGTPKRVHHIELFLDVEVQAAICERFDLLEDLDPADPHFEGKKQITLQRFLGYDFVRCSLEGLEWPMNYHTTADVAGLQRAGGRTFVDNQTGPITNWEQFESYPWPDPAKAGAAQLEWYSENLPEDMCIMGSGGFAHYAEFLTWLMGYETLCIALYEQRDLVEAIAKRLEDFYEVFLRRLLEYDRVKIIWGSDDMGFRTGTLISPDDLRAFVLPGHRRMAEMSHDAGLPYLLHSCGRLDDIIPDLLDDVKIDAKHSFEDTIEKVCDLKVNGYGQRTALLGGIDVDFLCRAGEAEVRQRVRETLDTCLPGGGYVLGSGNSVANYIPLDNYLAMVDEGRSYGA